MPEAVTILTYPSETVIGGPVSQIRLTSVTVGGQVDPGSGITQGMADARYIKMSQIDQPLGVAGLDANTFLAENELPLPPVTLTVLFTNQMT